MKKIIKSILPAFILAALVLIPKVEAKNITSLEAKAEEGKIVVKGKTETGVLAVTATVYDESGKNFITMQSTDVDENNNYKLEIDVVKGNYLVKVADYDGGEFKTAKVTVATDKDNPKTGDNIVAYIITLVLSLTTIVLTTIYIKTAKVDKK